MATPQPCAAKKRTTAGAAVIRAMAGSACSPVRQYKAMGRYAKTSDSHAVLAAAAA